MCNVSDVYGKRDVLFIVMEEQQGGTDYVRTYLVEREGEKERMDGGWGRGRGDRDRAREGYREICTFEVSRVVVYM